MGRTGTYIAIDYLLDRAKAEKKVNLYTLTKAMRENRVNMIQVDHHVHLFTSVIFLCHEVNNV